MSTLRIAPLLLGLTLVAGCSGDGDKTGGGDGKELVRAKDPWVDVSGRPSQHLELDDFDRDWEDIEVRDNGSRDPFHVATWVKERRDAVQRCLTANPPDQIQATELLAEILKHVPESSRDRNQLAQVTFADASYWFQTADRVGWEVDRLRVEKTARANGELLSDEDVEALVASYMPFLQRANTKCRESARRSLQQWELYRKLRPDDRTVSDYIWKLYFYLQDYRHALQWLDIVLREMDLNETPKEEPLRQDYEAIRRAMVEYMAELKIEGAEAGRGLQLGGGGRQRDRLNMGGFTPGE